MRICVVGAGAIGGLLGARLAEAGEDVTLIARGAHLEAIRARGLAVTLADGVVVHATDLAATGDMGECGAQDLVILGVKAHQIAPIVDEIHGLLGPNTIVLTTQNGIPWWYFQRYGGRLDGTPLDSVDPGGVIAKSIAPERIIGCIAYPAAEITAPGRIRHIEGSRFPIGELDGAITNRASTLSQMLQRAGFKAPVVEDIRAEIWLKAWGNLTFNPISALTHATLVDICRFPPTRDLAVRMMTEAQQVAAGLGISFRVSPREAHRGGGAGRHAQDVDAAGRRIRQGARDRGADRRGCGTRPADGDTDPEHRRRVCAGSTPWTHNRGGTGPRQNRAARLPESNRVRGPGRRRLNLRSVVANGLDANAPTFVPGVLRRVHPPPDPIRAEPSRAGSVPPAHRWSIPPVRGNRTTP